MHERFIVRPRLSNACYLGNIPPATYAHSQMETTPAYSPQFRQRPLPGATADTSPTEEQRPLQLLVVDDNEDGAEMLAMYLEASGHEVAIEYSATGALARAASQPFDAFLLDIGLPGMDGNELARRLRDMPGTAGAVLIAITGFGQREDGENGRQAGFDHYLVKPVDPAAIVTLLAGMAGR